jgi:hypothetical protein
MRAYQFKQIRELLNERHLILMEPDPKKEEGARKLLKVLRASTSMRSDKVYLANGTAIRALGGNDAEDYRV